MMNEVKLWRLMQFSVLYYFLSMERKTHNWAYYLFQLWWCKVLCVRCACKRELNLNKSCMILRRDRVSTEVYLKLCLFFLWKALHGGTDVHIISLWVEHHKVSDIEIYFWVMSAEGGQKFLKNLCLKSLIAHKSWLFIFFILVLLHLYFFTNRLYVNYLDALFYYKFVNALK